MATSVVCRIQGCRCRVQREGLNIEPASFGVAVKSVLPGTHTTALFSKMDIALQAPDDYRVDMDRFFNYPRASSGSAPEVTADVIYRAVTDGCSGRQVVVLAAGVEDLGRAGVRCRLQFWWWVRAAPAARTTTCRA